VESVATTGRPNAMKHDEASKGTLFCAASLHRFSLPYDFAKLERAVLPEVCYCYSTPLWDPKLSSSRAEKILIWQLHMGRCSGDDIKLQAREVDKMSLKDIVMSNPIPRGAAFPPTSI
jgi:hypothetical protein